MTENQQPLRVITCLDETGEREQCGALVENTLEARRIHRKWHAQDKTVKDAFRAGIKERDAKIRNLELKFADMQKDVENIDVPAPISPIEIASDGWSDDDEPDLDPEDTPSGAYEDAAAAFTATETPEPAPAVYNPVTGLYETPEP